MLSECLPKISLRRHEIGNIRHLTHFIILGNLLEVHAIYVLGPPGRRGEAARAWRRWRVQRGRPGGKQPPRARERPHARWIAVATSP